MENRKDYFTQEEAADYLHTTARKIGLYRRRHLLRFGRLGKQFIYKKQWLDDFMEEWSGYDLSNAEKVTLAIAIKHWREEYLERKDG